MSKPWQELLSLTRGREITVERIRLADSDIAVEGSFELPVLARLDHDDQTFIAAFVKCHGSIKQMEKYFGISYPTVKSRLNRIGEKLDFVEIEVETNVGGDVLDRLERGEISFDDAMRKLEEGE
jgi:hypothetical protein